MFGLSLQRKLKPRSLQLQRSTRLRVEELEPRVVMSTADGVFTPTIVAGSSKIIPKDSPALRVDANTIDSQFSGVVSVQVNTTKGTYIGSGALIYQDDAGGAYILTAGHMIDFNDDGQYTTADGINSIYVFFNVPDYDSADEPRLADYLDAVQLQQSDDPAQPAAMVLALAFALGGNWQRSVLERERRAP